MLTTKRGVFDDIEEVPKKKLVEGLRKRGPVHSTEELPNGVWWFDCVASARGDAQFEYAVGPVVGPPPRKRAGTP